MANEQDFAVFFLIPSMRDIVVVVVVSLPPPLHMYILYIRQPTGRVFSLPCNAIPCCPCTYNIFPLHATQQQQRFSLDSIT